MKKKKSHKQESTVKMTTTMTTTDILRLVVYVFVYNFFSLSLFNFGVCFFLLIIFHSFSFFFAIDVSNYVLLFT